MMSGLYTEADYENSIIELFQNMGYRHVYGPDVERDFYSPLYNIVPEWNINESFNVGGLFHIFCLRK